MSEVMSESLSSNGGNTFAFRFAKMWHDLIGSPVMNTRRYTEAQGMMEEADAEIARLRTEHEQFVLAVAKNYVPRSANETSGNLMSEFGEKMTGQSPNDKIKQNPLYDEKFEAYVARVVGESVHWVPGSGARSPGLIKALDELIAYYYWQKMLSESATKTTVLHEGVRQSYLKACELSVTSGLLGDGERSDLLELYESLWPQAPPDIRKQALLQPRKTP